MVVLNDNVFALQDAMLQKARGMLHNSHLAGQGLASTLSTATQITANEDWTRALAQVEEVRTTLGSCEGGSRADFGCLPLRRNHANPRVSSERNL